MTDSNKFKVFFTCAFSGREKYINDFRSVLKAIEKHSDIEVYTPEGRGEGESALTNGINYLNVLNLKRRKKLTKLTDLQFDTKENKFAHYDAIRLCIMICDAVIIDGTHPSFRLGHEATIAIQHKKPTLILSQSRDYSDLINTPYLYGAKYTKYNIGEIIDNFLKTAKKQALKHRFNLMISDEQKELLEQKALFEGISMGEYIRRLIEEDTNI